MSFCVSAITREEKLASNRGRSERGRADRTDWHHPRLWALAPAPHPSRPSTISCKASGGDEDKEGWSWGHAREAGDGRGGCRRAGARTVANKQPNTPDKCKENS
uniref:Uncharacterized protein n=1 Tax=Zea mays TaxID=4577 RepID=A0A804PWP1_MAIZE